MSDIKKGDLVVIVKPSPCCGNTKAVGKIYEVGSVSVKSAVCSNCGIPIHDTFVTLSINEHRNVQLDRVVKINPSRDEDYVETDNFMLA